MISGEFLLQCPSPHPSEEFILLSHGGGGRLTHRLIKDLFLPHFSNPYLQPLHDGAVFSLDRAHLAFTTDAFVVQPLFFPGGDIGKLAVTGTVNDLAMCGAYPLYLSASFILEEGFPISQLRTIVNSMHRTAQECGVAIITGDTKVVQKGKGDGVFITTTGIGRVIAPNEISPRAIKPGDIIILSGDLGRHSIAVLSARTELGLQTSVESDCAPLYQPVQALLEAGVNLHCLRDLTRGGLATALNEIASSAKLTLSIHEQKIPLHPEVQGICEVLGYDPLYLANEGRFIAILESSQGERAIEVLRSFQVTQEARIIGQVEDDPRGWVILNTVIGSQRILEMLSGEQLPRIC